MAAMTNGDGLTALVTESEAKGSASVLSKGGAVELRAKFQALREFVETIPAEKLDMHECYPRESDCGCVIFHARRQRSLSNPADDIYETLEKCLGDSAGLRPLFALGEMYERNDYYPVRHGQPAKELFLSRLTALEEKHCGPVASATAPVAASSDPTVTP